MNPFAAAASATAAKKNSLKEYFMKVQGMTEAQADAAIAAMNTTPTE